MVVPTRDRNALLARCLDQLAPTAQSAAPEYEVIVSDDSAERAAGPLVRANFPWARVVEGPRRGPAANRNAGARAATGELLVFLDDDCVPERELLSGYASALRADVVAYEGRITCREGVRSPLTTSPVNLTGGTLWSCNFAMRRDVFAELGGFDERFPTAHMEDADLRDRIMASGHSIAFVPGASVDHPPRRLAWGAKLAAMHRATVLYMTLHPPMRSYPWFFQNLFRARVSRVLHLPLSVDSLIALASVPVELAVSAWHWREWHRWARTVTEPGA